MSEKSKQKVFLLVSNNPERIIELQQIVETCYHLPVVYTASSEFIAISKTRNSHVDVLICDSKDSDKNAMKMLETVLLENKNAQMAIIIIGHPPKEAQYLDEIVIGKLQFIDEELREPEISSSIARSLNFTFRNQPTEFHLIFLAPGDILISEGDPALFIYILKSGRLNAYKLVDGQQKILGYIETGEFVGEMSYINKDVRSATIESITNSELIELPIGLVDSLLFKRPSWSMALMKTLSKRLSNANSIAPKV